MIRGFLRSSHHKNTTQNKTEQHKTDKFTSKLQLNTTWNVTGQTSSWFSQTYEKYTNKRAYAFQFYRWKHADTAPRSQEDRTIHRIHKWRPLGTAWFRIHENEALTVEGGRGYEPSLKLPYHWIHGVCLQKKVRRSHLKGHNERFSTIVWNFLKGKLFMTPFNVKKPCCLCRPTVKLLCGLVQLRTISSEHLLKPNTIYHKTVRKLVLSNFIFISDLTRTLASHMQIHKVIGSLPAMHQRGFNSGRNILFLFLWSSVHSTSLRRMLLCR